MIDLALLARMEAARLVAGLAEVSEESRVIGGGLMVRGEPGLWSNYACGVGFDGALSAEELDALELYYTEKGIEPRIECTPYVHPSVLRQLEDRLWRIRGFETVFFREIEPSCEISPLVPEPSGLEIIAVPRDDPTLLRVFAETSVSGFMRPGSEPSEAQITLAVRSAAHPRSTGFLAFVDGQPAAAGSCTVCPTRYGTAAALFGLSTREEFRRRGIQQSLIAARLRWCAAQGATVATIGGLPGAGTERNVRRMGFAVAYTMVILVKPGGGLVPVQD